MVDTHSGRTSHPARSLRSGWILAVCLGLLLPGCARVRPTTITSDRFDYGEQVAESWKRQMLVNIVRLRYADTPAFMDVASVINSYSQTGTLGAGAFLYPSAHPMAYFPLNAQGTWSNTPTVTYLPLTGDRFTHSLLQPITPTVVFQMLQAGWPPELIFRLAVQSVNDITAAGPDDAAADPRFDRMVQALDPVMHFQAMGIRIEPRKEGDTAVLVIRAPGNAEAAAGIKTLRDLWQLDPAANEFSLTFGGPQRDGKQLTLITRSMLQIMMALALDVEVPATEQATNRAFPGRSQSSAKTQSLVQIHSGKSVPADAFVSVPYKGGWFWIDDHDVTSKSRFTFLMILSSLAETGAAGSAPVLTVPSR
jgi:hypothetical protein